MFKIQPQKVCMFPIAHNYANITQTRTRLPPKEVTIQELSINMQIKAFCKYMSLKCLKTYCAPRFKV